MPAQIRTGQTKPPVERLFCIARVLRASGRLTSTELCSHFEVCRKTVGRDIEFMRDRLGWDIGFDESQNTYVLRSKPPTPVL